MYHVPLPPPGHSVSRAHTDDAESCASRTPVCRDGEGRMEQHSFRRTV